MDGESDYEVLKCAERCWKLDVSQKPRKDLPLESKP